MICIVVTFFGLLLITTVVFVKDCGQISMANDQTSLLLLLLFFHFSVFFKFHNHNYVSENLHNVALLSFEALT